LRSGSRSLGLALLAVTSCGPGSITNIADEVSIRDLRQISIEPPATAADAGGVLGSGRVSLGDGASTDYVVRAARTDAGAPEVHWETGAALYNGEYHAVLPADGVLRFTGERGAAPEHPWTTRDGRLVLTACTWLAEKRSGGGYYGRMPMPVHHLGYEIRAAVPCPRLGVPEHADFTIESPLENVSEVRRTIVHQRETRGTLAIIGGNLMFIGIFPVAYGAATHSPASEIVGFSVAGTGLVMLIGALAFLPSDRWEETVTLPVQ
jgi:hypothetical protein